MKITAYLRVSTSGQEISNQRLAILDYAQQHQLKVDDFLEVQVSSRKSLRERGIDGLFAGMQAGDLLLVSELSRLGRSVGQIIQIVDELIKHQIKFIAIKENIHLNGKQDIQSKVMVTMFGLFAEIERDLIWKCILTCAEVFFLLFIPFSLLVLDGFEVKFKAKSYEAQLNFSLYNSFCYNLLRNQLYFR